MNWNFNWDFKNYSTSFHATCSHSSHCALNGNFTHIKITMHIYGTAFDSSALNFMQIFLTIRELEFIKTVQFTKLG